MILKGAAAARYCAAPDPGHAALLIWGADAMRVALMRQDAVAAIVGPQGEAEMRLERLAAAEVRRDGAALGDALRAQGFFPGPRVVLVEDAGDGLAEAMAAALADWRPGDARLVVTAGELAAKSALRGVFEGHRAAVAIGLYDDPPTREQIEADLARAGLAAVAPAALEELLALGRTLEPGDFRQTLEKVALYKHGDRAPLTAEEVAALAPATVEAGVDEVMAAVAEGRPGAVGPLMQRLAAQGVQPVALAIAATRHFRALHAAACDPGGPAAGLGRMRGIPFRARDAMVRQAGAWGPAQLERALSVLVETDLALRSSSRAPGFAVIERALLRLAYLGSAQTGRGGGARG